MNTTELKPAVLQGPHVHLNGTSADDLLDQICEANVAVNDAIDALKQATPNGRDYYPLGADAFERAREQHRSRMLRLQSVSEELVDLAGLIQ